MDTNRNKYRNGSKQTRKAAGNRRIWIDYYWETPECSAAKDSEYIAPY